MKENLKVIDYIWTDEYTYVEFLGNGMYAFHYMGVRGGDPSRKETEDLINAVYDESDDSVMFFWHERGYTDFDEEAIRKAVKGAIERVKEYLEEN